MRDLQIRYARKSCTKHDWIFSTISNPGPVIQPNLSRDGEYCIEADPPFKDKESAASIKIQNGIVIESKCVKKAVLMLTFANNPMVIGYDGKFHLFALLTFY